MNRLLGLTPKNGNRSGDTMPMYHDGKWHIFVSDPPNGKWLFPGSAAVSTFHIVSKDLIHWEQVECNDLHPGKKGSYDQDGLWTGCVIEKNGTFASPAIALANSVFPVPGDPTNNTPFGIFPPSF